MDTPAPPFFWLHIKKCSGGSIRRMLAPHDVLARRVHRPVNFIQLAPELWNDILNNFRVPLGEYQFRRCAFAHRFLWPDSGDSMLRFSCTVLLLCGASGTTLALADLHAPAHHRIRIL